MALGLLNETTTTSFSLVSLGQALPAAALSDSDLGVRAIQVTIETTGPAFEAAASHYG